MLPVRDTQFIISLGEGFTPLLAAPRTQKRLGLSRLLLKDESLNPTGSIKARGLSCAISMCRQLGVKRVAASSAGNVASATAAYAAAAGIEAFLFMPQDVPQSNFIECQAYGAHVTLVAGLISDCSRVLTERKGQEDWFELSTLKEPYRVEGNKTAGYELAEQLGWKLPDVILYPAGGGVGLIGIWKAFSEMEQLGWIGPERPKMIAVEAAGRQPIVRAFEQDPEHSGTTITVSDRERIDAGIQVASEDGLFLAPEGAACVKALEKLVQSGFVEPAEQVVIYNTGSGLKYLEAYSTRFPRSSSSDADKLGGLITPR